MRILVVEDHALVREGLLTTLRALGPDTTTIGAEDGTQAIQVLENSDIDLMLLDLMLPGTRGLTLLPLVRRRFPTVPVVVVSALDDTTTVARAMGAGASGFISKAASSKELLRALRKVLAGGVVVPAGAREAVARSSPRCGDDPLARRYSLTPAQTRVLQHLAEGVSNREIAELLGVTEGTVKIHVSAVMRALNVSNRAEAALIAAGRKR